MNLTKELREMDRLLKKNGYYATRWKGSHRIYSNDTGRIISVNKDLNMMVKKRLIKEYALS